jgi:hypothetical protein
MTQPKQEERETESKQKSGEAGVARTQPKNLELQRKHSPNSTLK